MKNKDADDTVMKQYMTDTETEEEDDETPTPKPTKKPSKKRFSETKEKVSDSDVNDAMKNVSSIPFLSETSKATKSKDKKKKMSVTERIAALQKKEKKLRKKLERKAQKAARKEEERKAAEAEEARKAAEAEKARKAAEAEEARKAAEAEEARKAAEAEEARKAAEAKNVAEEEEKPDIKGKRKLGTRKKMVARRKKKPKFTVDESPKRVTRSTPKTTEESEEDREKEKSDEDEQEITDNEEEVIPQKHTRASPKKPEKKETTTVYRTFRTRSSPKPLSDATSNLSNETATKWNLGFPTEEENQTMELIKMRVKYATKMLMHEVNKNRAMMSEKAHQFARDYTDKDEKQKMIKENIKKKKAEQDAQHIPSAV